MRMFRGGCEFLPLRLDFTRFLDLPRNDLTRRDVTATMAH